MSEPKLEPVTPAPPTPALSGVTSPPPQSHRITKECGVCGDKALGYNFNAITCESCKAFFRRNALKTKVFRCPFSDNCSIDVVTRRFCQKCRLKKCYTIGMKKEWIMTDEERKMKRQKIAENRCRRGDGGPLGSPYTEASPPGWLPHSPVSPESGGPAAAAAPDHGLQPLCGSGGESPQTPPQQQHLQQPQQHGLHPQHRAPHQHRAVQVPESPPPAHGPAPSLDDGSICISTILGKALRAEFSATHLREPVMPSGALNGPEQEKIAELLEAEQALMAPLNEDNVNLVNTDPSLINVINLCDIAIRRLIKMSKKISSFRSLCQRDQIALLKGGCTELMILRSVTTYDEENNSWNIPANETDYTSIKLNVLKKAPYDVYEAHKQFNRTFSHRWKTDRYIMGIISAVTLFSPTRPNLEHVDAITLEQESYYYLLRRYLLTTMAACEARSEFLKLIRKMEELHRLNEDHIKIFMDVDPVQVEPLLIEIFDLKCGNAMRSVSGGQDPHGEPSLAGL